MDSCSGYLADAELFRPLAQSFRTLRTPQLDAISKQAQDIWKQALLDCQTDKLIRDHIDLDHLARRLHISFRVAFWMWATEELANEEFRAQALCNTAACRLPVTTTKGKKRLNQLMESDPALAS